MPSSSPILTIPAVQPGGYDAQMPLHYSDLMSHAPIDLIAIPVESLGTFLTYFSSLPSAQEQLKATNDLNAGRLLTTDVPVLVTPGSSNDLPTSFRRLELLPAMGSLGFKHLPVLANEAAAAWLRKHVHAVEAPTHWSVRD